MIKLASKAIFHSKPEINRLTADFKNYDLIVIGTPSWANNITPPFNTVLKNYDFNHKNIAVVVTVDPKRASSHTLYDLRHKLIARGAHIVFEDTIGVVGVSDEELSRKAQEIVNNLMPLKEMRQPEKQAVANNL